MAELLTTDEETGQVDAMVSVIRQFIPEYLFLTPEAVNRKTTLIHKLEHFFTVYLQHQLNKWIDGTIDENEMNEVKSLFPCNGPGTVIVTQINRYEYFTYGITAKRLDEIMKYMRLRMKELLSPIGHSVSFFHGMQKGMMVTVFISPGGPDLLFKDCIKGLNGFIQNLKSDYEINSSIGVGGESNRIFYEVKRCFAEAEKALSYKFFRGSGKTIDFSSIPSDTNSRLANLHLLEDELAAGIHHSERGRVMEIINEFFRGMGEGDYIHPSSLKDGLTHILLNLAKIIYSHIPEEHFGSFMEDARKRIMQCEEYKELRQVINEKLSNIMDILNEKDHCNFIIIQKCKKYIEENYMKDISLDCIAGKFHFNASYFSCLFKECTGTGFVEYLLKVRIQKAQQLLRSTDYKLSEIAGLVGFHNAAYFNRMFKRKIGISPNKYKRL